MRTEYWWINAEIKGYEGGEGKITGRVNVCGAWDWGRVPNGSRRLPEEMVDGNNTKEARNIYVAPIIWHKGIESFIKLKTHSLNTKA